MACKECFSPFLGVSSKFGNMQFSKFFFLKFLLANKYEGVDIKLFKFSPVLRGLKVWKITNKFVSFRLQKLLSVCVRLSEIVGLQIIILQN